MEKELERYTMAAAYLPVRLRKAVLCLPEEQQRCAEEFRLRAGQKLTVLLPGGEQALEELVETEDLELLCDLATEFSRYAAAETIREGYLSVRGGFRIGLCGTAVIKEGANTNLKSLSSAALRISREHPGISASVLPRLMENGSFRSTLILSPPGGGKTTLLRDLVRNLSDGTVCPQALRVALIDERGEVAVSYQGRPQMDVGRHTDVLDSCPKRIGIPMVLRAMNPQVIAVDEITLQEDLTACLLASGCGAELLATIHASSMEELLGKPLYQRLLDTRVFRKAIWIDREQGERRYRVEDLP